jgi:hypothetical protein
MDKGLRDGIQQKIEAISDGAGFTSSNILAIVLIAALTRTAMDGPYKTTVSFFLTLIINCLYSGFTGYIAVFLMRGYDHSAGSIGAAGGIAAFLSKELLLGLINVGAKFGDSPFKFVNDVIKIIRGRNGKDN